MKLINGTKQKQQIHFIDGSSVFVLPGKSVNIDKNKLYDFEMYRVSTLLTPEKQIKKATELPKKEEIKKDSNEKVKSFENKTGGN